MEKMKKSSNSGAVDFSYAIYMMVGSYFEKTYCSNPYQEVRYRASYWESKQEKQWQMEETVLGYVENTLAKKLPGSFWKQEVKVSFPADLKDDESAVWFIADNQALLVKGKYAGKHTSLSYEIHQKALEEDSNR